MGFFDFDFKQSVEIYDDGERNVFRSRFDGRKVKQTEIIEDKKTGEVQVKTNSKLIGFGKKLLSYK